MRAQRGRQRPNDSGRSLTAESLALHTCGYLMITVRYTRDCGMGLASTGTCGAPLAVWPIRVHRWPFGQFWFWVVAIPALCRELNGQWSVTLSLCWSAECVGCLGCHGQLLAGLRDECCSAARNCHAQCTADGRPALFQDGYVCHNGDTASRPAWPGG